MSQRVERAALRLAPQPKLALHPQFARYVSAGERVYPIGIEISPSGVCQASCDFCWYAGGELGGHRNVMLETGRAAELIEECLELGVRSVSWTGGGEPTLHPKFARLVNWADLFGLKQGLFTNALASPLYDPAKLEWVRVTITNRPCRPDCIKPLRAAKTLSFAFNYAGPRDDDRLNETLDLCALVGGDYVQVRPALAFHGATVDIDPPGFGHPLMHVTDYKFEEARRRHGYERCEGFHFVPFLWEDGNLDVCAYMRKHPGYTLGNVYKDSLKDILDRAPRSVPVHENCQICCKLHEMNTLIHESRELLDIDFP